MFSEVLRGDAARQAMLVGVNEVADTVRVTLGVHGRNAALDANPHTKPLITNDGVSIARSLVFKDRYQNLGAKYIKEAAAKTDDQAGDGTSTNIVLTQAIIQGGMKAIANGAQLIPLRHGIDAATGSIVAYTQGDSVKSTGVEMLTDIATISCRNPKLGRLIAETVDAAGANGMITLEDTYDHETTVDKFEGIKLNGGYLNHLYVNNVQTQQAVLNDVLVVVSLQTLTTSEEMAAIMEACVNANKKEVVVFANGIEGMALTTSAINWEKNIKVLPVRVIAYGDLGEGMLRDVAAITGATFMDGTPGHSIIEFTSQDFGTASKVVTDRHSTTVISKDEKLKKERTKELIALRDTSTEFEKENINERIAKLESAMFTIKVGGITDSDRAELKTRVQDALNAAKAASTDGIVPGGGTELYRAGKAKVPTSFTGDEATGYKVVLDACLAPFKQLAANSNVELYRDDYEKIRDHKNAIDFRTGEVVDAFKTGILDPAKVVTEALTNAAVQAGLFLTTEAAVVLLADPQEEQL